MWPVSGFFRHENKSFPAELSYAGKLHTFQKYQLANTLEATLTPPDNRSECGTIIIDGPFLVYCRSPNPSKTFEEYAVKNFVPKIQDYT